MGSCSPSASPENAKARLRQKDGLPMFNHKNLDGGIMPEQLFKINISPERKAKIEAENMRLQPLRDTLDKLVKEFSFSDIYYEMGCKLHEACCDAVFDKQMPMAPEDGVKYLVDLICKTIYDVKYNNSFFISAQHYIESGVKIEPELFIIEAMTVIIKNSGNSMRDVWREIASIYEDFIWEDIERQRQQTGKEPQ